MTQNRLHERITALMRILRESIVHIAALPGSTAFDGLQSWGSRSRRCGA